MKTVLVSCLVLFLSLSLVVHSEKNPLDVNLLRGLLQGGEKDCTFKCFGGVRPRPKSGHTPKTNGCGVEGMHLNLGEFTFLEACCNAHDFCYDTCNRSKEQCDGIFQRCSEKECEEKGKKRVEDCKKTAMVMLTGAQVLGCETYKESQKGACDCRPKEL